MPTVAGSRPESSFVPAIRFGTIQARWFIEFDRLIMALSRRQSQIRRLEHLGAVSRPVELPIITDERGMEWRCVGGQNGYVLVAPARQLTVEEWVAANRVDAGNK